jgi:uncharacterized protein
MRLKKRTVGLVLTAVLSLSGLTACGDDTVISDPGGTSQGSGQGSGTGSGSDAGSDPGSGSGTTTTSRQNPPPATQPVSISPQAICPVPADTDFEGYFTTSPQMKTYLDCIVPGVDGWLDIVYSGMPHPKGYYFIPRGVTGQMGCKYSEDSLGFCPSTQVVFMGEAAVWSEYTKRGDAAGPVILAHEVTHYLQHHFRMPPAPENQPNKQVRYENQADCGAGAFMAYAKQKRWMNVEDDLKDLSGSLIAVGEAEGPEQEHGTIEQRIGAFNRSYLSGLAQPMQACNAYVPEVPIWRAATR